MALDLGWAIAFDGGHVYRIPTQHLPPGSVEVVLSGSGAHVAATLEVRAAGELGDWADLLQITKLALSLTAETAN